jgi:hypothetical protein
MKKKTKMFIIIFLICFCVASCIGAGLFYFFVYKKNKDKVKTILEAAARDKVIQAEVNSSVNQKISDVNALSSFNDRIALISGGVPNTSIAAYAGVHIPQVDTKIQNYFMEGAKFAANTIAFAIIEKVLKRIAKLFSKETWKGAFAVLKNRSAFWRMSKTFLKKGWSSLAVFFKWKGKVGTKITAMATKELLKGVGKAATKEMMALVTSASMGPIGIALIVFEVISMAIDMSEANHYKLIDPWMAVKKGLDAELEKMGIDPATFPPTVSPLDKLFFQVMPSSNFCDANGSDGPMYAADGSAIPPKFCYPYQTSLNVASNKHEEYLAAEKDGLAIDTGDDHIMPDPNMYIYLFQYEMYNIMQTDKEYETLCNDLLDSAASEGGISEEDCNIMIDKLLEKKSSVWMEQASDNMCYRNGGTILSDANKTCMSTKTECDKPLVEGEVMERVWTNGKCVAVIGVTQAICEDKKMPYNPDTGVCKLTAAMCKGQAGTPYPDADGDTPVNDCRVNMGLEMCGGIFGETICKTFFQLLDDSQFWPCKDDETKSPTGLFCTENCKNGYILRDGICNAPMLNRGLPNGCPEGYASNGANLCFPKCETGYNFRGIDSNLKPIDYSACVKDCGEYNRSNKSGLCYKNCPEGWVSNNMGLCSNPLQHFVNEGYLATIDKTACNYLSDVTVAVGVGDDVPPTCSGVVHKPRGQSYIPNCKRWNKITIGDDLIQGCPRAGCKTENGGGCKSECCGAWDAPCNRNGVCGTCTRSGCDCGRYPTYCIECHTYDVQGSCAEFHPCEPDYTQDATGTCNWLADSIKTHQTTYQCNGDDILQAGYCYKRHGRPDKYVCPLGQVLADEKCYAIDMGVPDYKGIYKGPALWEEGDYDGSICGKGYFMAPGSQGTCTPHGGTVIAQDSITPDEKRNDNSRTANCPTGTTYKGGSCYMENCPAGTSLIPGIVLPNGTCTTDGTAKTTSYLPVQHKRVRSVAMA